MLLRTLRWTCAASAVALLGCATDPDPNTTNVDESSASSASESGTSGMSETGETGETGEPEGCTVMSGCADDEFCDFPDGLCGAGEPGACAPRPGVCSDDPESECGCDGMAYTQNCANVMGVDTNVDAASCMAPAGYFACGPLLCDSNSFFCLLQLSDIGGEPDSYSCSPFPNGCGDPVDCMCLVDMCGGQCDATGAGFTVTCAGG